MQGWRLRTYAYREPVDEDDASYGTDAIERTGSKPDFDAGYDAGYRSGWVAGYTAGRQGASESVETEGGESRPLLL